MNRYRAAITVIEVVCVLFVLALLIALIMPASERARETARHAGEVAYMSQAGMALPETSAGEGKAANADKQPTADALDRKIIYTANIDLVVEDFSDLNERVAALVKRFDGYIADSALTGTKGETRRATWRLRIPIASFDDFVSQAKQLGELVGAKTLSQDVSEEFYDVEARIRNNTKEETRLLALLEERPGKLEDVIAIERELSRVREELERMQGRMRVLADRTSMTTIQLAVAEVHNYQPVEAATFATRIRRAFEDSISGLQIAAEFAVISVVALLPWFAVLSVVAGIAYWFIRRFGRPFVRPTTIP